jgi:hypothetical protein
MEVQRPGGSQFKARQTNGETPCQPIKLDVVVHTYHPRYQGSVNKPDWAKTKDPI